MSPDQAKTFFRRIDSLRDKAPFSLLYGSGLRVSEALGLDIEEMNLEEREFRVVGKGDRERVGYLGEDTVSLLRRYLRERGCPRQGPVFESRHGTRLSYSTAWRLFRKYANGLEENSQLLTIHQLRHSFGSDRTGAMDALILRDLMGHKSLRTTLQYAQVNEESVYLLNTMKIRSIRWTTVLGLGLLILVGGVAVAQQTTANVVAGSGKVLDARWADTPDAKKTEKARDVIDGMRSLVSRVLAHREEARGERDVIKLSCVNEKLTGIKELLRVSEQASLTLEYALARGDAGVAIHEFGKIMVAKTKCDELFAGSESCIGQLEPSVLPERRGPVVGEVVGEVVVESEVDPLGDDTDGGEHHDAHVECDPDIEYPNNPPGADESCGSFEDCNGNGAFDLGEPCFEHHDEDGDDPEGP
jgi:hypothetical protein